jgi:transcriptional regulator with XRE-family HTH domain
MTQAELASAVGRDRTYIVKIERGAIRLPQPEQRDDFHKVLGTSEDELRFLGIVPTPGTGWAFSYEANVSGTTVSPSQARADVAALARDPRIPDDAIEGIRRVLLGYLERSE